MGAEIERIVDRKTIRGRVHYLVVWRGFGEESNTWESRMDLVADGYSNVIRTFEHGRKGQDGEDGAARGRSKSPGRARGRSRSNSTPRSPSASKGRGRKAQQEVDSNGEVVAKPARKRAAKKADKDAAAVVTAGDTSATKTKAKKTVVSVLSSSSSTSSTSSSTTSTARKTTHKEAKHIEVAYEQDNLKASKTVVSHTEQLEVEPMKEPSEGDASELAVSAWKALKQSGALLWSGSALVVVLSLVASYYLPVLGYDDASSTWRLWIPFLTPVIALLLVFRQVDSRVSLKWVAIGLAWRAAAELLFLVGTDFQTYWQFAIGSFAIADLALVIAVAAIIVKREHIRSKATLAVLVLGVLAVFLSDSWILQGTAAATHTRTTLMAAAVLTISLSPMLTTALDEDN